MVRFEEDWERAANPCARLGTGALLGALLGFLFETHGMLASELTRLDGARLLDVEFGLASGLSASAALLWVEDMRRRFYPTAPGAAFAVCLHLTFVVSLSLGQESFLRTRQHPIAFYELRSLPIREAMVDGLLSAALCGGTVLLFQLVIEPRLRRGVAQRG